MLFHGLVMVSQIDEADEIIRIISGRSVLFFSHHVLVFFIKVIEQFLIGILGCYDLRSVIAGKGDVSGNPIIHKKTASNNWNSIILFKKLNGSPLCVVDVQSVELN